ncbi:TPA: hypothetical protein ACH3X1_000664 [Trebouxia sp. C0004]
MADAFEIQRDRLLAEVDNVHNVLVRKHNSGLVLCKCDDCSSEDIFVWERNNFVHRSKAYIHMIAQCKRKRTAVTEKDKQKDISFWRPESVVVLYKREVVAALQAELDEQPFQVPMDLLSLGDADVICQGARPASRCDMQYA